MKGYKGNIFVALDISDPTHPKEVSRWWVKGRWEEGGEKADRFYQLHGPPDGLRDRAYLPYDRAGFVTLDISDLSHSRQIARIDIGDFGSVVGARTYLPIPSRKLAIATTEAILEEERDPLNLALVVDMKNEEKPKPIAYFIPATPKKKRGLLPKELATQTEDVIVDKRG